MGARLSNKSLWLDVTRTLTRIGRGAPTGIDRVELEYLKNFLSLGCKQFLCRTTRGYLLLDGKGANVLRDLAEGRRPMGKADLISRLTMRGNRPRHRVEAALRSVAIDKCRTGRLCQMLARNTFAGCAYFNVGHSNLSEEVLSTFAQGPGCLVLTLIHDLIPITHPDLVADTQPLVFAERIERVCRYASHVIVNSEATAQALAHHWSGATRVPETLVAHLGVTPAAAIEGPRDPMHFVMLGTIEPRKNHAMMIDVWEAFARERGAEPMPQLHIIGNIGWKVPELVARLEAHPLRGTAIHLHGPLPDADVQSHLSKAAALLFPSVTEGFGLPPLEAAMAGVVPICSNLPVFHETLGDCAVYVNNLSAYHWQETIGQLIDGKLTLPDLTKIKIPTWQEHFEIVAEAINARNLQDHA